MVCFILASFYNAFWERAAWNDWNSPPTYEVLLRSPTIYIFAAISNAYLWSFMKLWWDDKCPLYFKLNGHNLFFLSFCWRKKIKNLFLWFTIWQITWSRMDWNEIWGTKNCSRFLFTALLIFWQPPLTFWQHFHSLIGSIFYFKNLSFNYMWDSREFHIFNNKIVHVKESHFLLRKSTITNASGACLISGAKSRNG